MHEANTIAPKTDSSVSFFAHMLFSSAHQGWRSTYREKGKIERAFDSHFQKMFRMTAYPVKVFFE
ncbi:hypothetical protein [Pseudomonas capsici]|uniref:hypothetical protein n=1 Tax=Pseudomonas capsici TaxID=2810614 RepID=UPI001910A6B6|nr:hypothetical protein [Pseudomonas capsici]MBX8614881.1 hypothetical protein [Pseudomonas cichorii]MCV4264887.1 hypothetical protein [Pseudomonas capsici]